jgi:hypothetical protein
VSRPLFSVVIPTRDRADVLRYCLRTCLAQHAFDDYEVVVSDNAGPPATRQAVEECRSPRLAYVRSDRPLSMSDSWELAVSRARGRYVTVLGDDDGLMPFALPELARLIDRHDRPPAIHWFAGLYTWPTIAVPEEANFLRLPTDRSCSVLSGREMLARASRYEIGPEHLPMIYRSVIRADLIERHREMAGGRVFPTLYPDVYSGYAFAYLAARYVSVGLPMSVAGLSGKSNGVATLMRTDANPIAKEFERLHKEAGLTRHPTVPAMELLPVNPDDSFQHARDLFFANDHRLQLDRKKAAQRYLAAIPDRDPQARARARAAIRASLADTPDLLPWFDELPDPPPCPPYRCRPAAMGFDGWGLTLDTTRFGVTDMAGAVRLACDVLGLEPGAEVRYDLPSRQQCNAAWSEAVTGREEQARVVEGELAEAEARYAEAVEERDAYRERCEKLMQDRDEYRQRWTKADDEREELRLRVERLEAEAARQPAAAAAARTDDSLLGLAKRFVRKMVGG